ncbi:IclR family transcriptional regulator [Saccharopolyspora sp. K220]|uniref:IclR family transcriptional regulator n=1 Tax=Saccharopolyspora soli TaxID=2926618 RepID=UPI001F57DC4A|nr:IclR family transcriptional regulator [Saccharopolyspora soli]MCI2417870.1 IclR family transcriptional regulator [Saccharopolyspora soli]
MSTAPVSAAKIPPTAIEPVTELPEDMPRVSMLGRAARILNSFGPQEWVLSLAELTRKSGLPKPTAHRIAAELADLGLLERSGKGYCLGIQLVEIGQRSWWQCGLRDTALPFLEYLREATNHTVNLGVLADTDVVYLAKLPGADNDVRISRTGARLPAHSTGLGKAILAFSPPATLRSVVESGLARCGPRTIIMPRRFIREMALIRQRGTAFDIEESGPGVLCVAAAISLNHTRVLGSLSISGCSTAAELDRTRPIVESVARELSRRLTAEEITQ